MLAVAENIAVVEADERETRETAPVVTTLYDLMVALHDEVGPGGDDLVTAAVADLCNRGCIRFLEVPEDWEDVCA